MNQPPVDKPTLSAGEQAAHELHQLGLSTRAIAYALNCSRSTIRSRLSNAQRKLNNGKQPA